MNMWKVIKNIIMVGLIMGISTLAGCKGEENAVGDEFALSHNKHEGLEKVLIQTSEIPRLYLDGFIHTEELELLLEKDNPVKVYHNVECTKYTYFTPENLVNTIITVGKHSSYCHECGREEVLNKIIN